MQFRLSALFSLMIFFTIITSAEEIRRARLFSIGQTEKAPLFTQETKITSPTAELKNWNSVITDGEGKIVMTEKIIFKDGQVVSQYVEQLQMNEAYEMLIKDNKVTFKSFKLKDGKAILNDETSSKQIGTDFVIGPTVETFIFKNWHKIRDKKTVIAEFAIFEVMKLIDFEFRQTKAKENSIEIEMKPKNMMISMLVDPILLEFSNDGKKMLRYVGRTPVRILDGRRWRPFDSEILYP